MVFRCSGDRFWSSSLEGVGMILWRVLLGPVDHSKGMNVIRSRFYGAQPSIRSQEKIS